MKKVALLSVFVLGSCLADIVCIDNHSGDDVTLSLRKGAYVLYECNPDGLGIKSVPVEYVDVTLRNGEQYLLKTEYTFQPTDSVCGFSLDKIGEEVSVVDIMSHSMDEFHPGSWLIEVIENDASAPLSGKAFFSDRMYKITKSRSAPSSPRKELESSLTGRKRSASDPSSSKTKADD